MMKVLAVALWPALLVASLVGCQVASSSPEQAHALPTPAAGPVPGGGGLPDELLVESLTLDLDGDVPNVLRATFYDGTTVEDPTLDPTTGELNGITVTGKGRVPGELLIVSGTSPGAVYLCWHEWPCWCTRWDATRTAGRPFNMRFDREGRLIAVEFADGSRAERGPTLRDQRYENVDFIDDWIYTAFEFADGETGEPRRGILAQSVRRASPDAAS